MVGYTLFKSLERELAILKTRGVPLGGLVRFTYAQVLALTLVSILLSPLGIISAKGFVETFGSVFSGPLTARGLTPLAVEVLLMWPIPAELASKTLLVVSSGG
jgi:hypothetical protein